MSRYHFAQHVHHCWIDGRIVFLDLVNDRYSCLSAAQSEIFHAAMQNCGGGATERLSFLASPGSVRLLATMELNGLLTRCPQADVPLTVKTVARPARDLASEQSGAHGSETHRSRFGSFLKSCFVADMNLRYQRMFTTVAAVRQRPRTSADLGLFRAQVLAFQRMRPYYPRAYLCLFDSLALITYLSFAGLSADWVFGVQLAPFKAHCWVQAGDVVLNDHFGFVRCFTPIMIV